MHLYRHTGSCTYTHHAVAAYMCSRGKTVRSCLLDVIPGHEKSWKKKKTLQESARSRSIIWHSVMCVLNKSQGLRVRRRGGGEERVGGGKGENGHISRKKLGGKWVRRKLEEVSFVGTTFSFSSFPSPTSPGCATHQVVLCHRMCTCVLFQKSVCEAWRKRIKETVDEIKSGEQEGQRDNRGSRRPCINSNSP